jgi:uncharacterized protein
MKKFFIFLINLYQKTPLRSHSACIFIPTCSEYMKGSILKYGLIIGVFKGFKRILRCHPWNKSTYDPF